ncbi:MAG: long-chain fatty acid--CoA ligase [Acidobacteria bacterium]|nr:MAG: long-chain fatty acid--CoA ligase [Acidobacteriota bacterium]
MSATTLNLAHLLDYQARLTPDREALVCGPARLTYGQLSAMASQAANGLRAIGIKAGDHIALSCPNTPHFVVAYFAILRVGAVVVPLNVLLKPREIAYHLRDSDAVAMLVFEGTPELPMAQMARAACDEVTTCRQLIVMTVDPAAPPPVDHAITLGQLMHGRSPVSDTHPARPDDTAVILYTSGTTGQPKGAELSHLNMVFNATASRDIMLPLLPNTVDERACSLITLPLFHSTGQTAQMNAGLAGGYRLILLPRFDPAAVFAAFENERVHVWVGVPTMYWALVQYAKKSGIDAKKATASLRLCVSGGAPMPVPLMQEIEREFGVRVLEGYGLSETAPVACFNQVFRPSKPGTVGQPLVACEVRVVDDSDTPVATGERGEVVIRGHNVMKGYYKRPAETAEALKNGWFHTGDIGVLDADGFLAIVDRKKDMVLRGGLNVYPREIEEVLLTHPAVSLAAVIGVPDERLGEEVKAFIVRRPGMDLTADELIAWCKEQFAAYKYPRIVEFRDALPMGATGKVLKRELR